MLHKIPSGLDWLITYLINNYPMTDELTDAIMQAREIEKWEQPIDYSQN